MKLSECITFVGFIICLIACADKKSIEGINHNIPENTTVVKASVIDTFKPGQVINKIICKSDSSQSYALYIPAGVAKKLLPVIYFFDPQGDGKLPLNKYKSLAVKYNFILIGSNNSKNGNDWPTAENIWNAMLDDSRKRLKINTDQIYVCGFSGGAKVAGYVALHHNEVKAVIANSAGLPDEIAPVNFSFPITFIAGGGDMNMTDITTFNNELDITQTRHHIIFFDGIHEWAPETAMNTAFEGLQLDGVYQKLIPKNEKLIGNYINESKNRIAKYFASGNLIKAEQECNLSITMLSGVTNDVSWFKEKDTSLKNNSAWQKQWQYRQKLFITEQTIKAGYRQKFGQPDIDYWTKTINDLEIKIKHPNDETPMYQRLQAYLSLAFYSFSNRFVNTDQNEDAQYFVDLYKLADPANSEAWYLSAIINARNNKAQATENDLINAARLGFADKERMMMQPDFTKLANQINFKKIEEKMKK